LYAEAGVVVVAYVDHAEGFMEEKLMDRDASKE
jgi:hypothetical protein